jgi:hypothetical protein
MTLTADEWLAEVQKAITQYFPNIEPRIELVRHTRITIRFELNDATFVALFFREETERVDYALIVNDQRVFGIDNLDGWHIHPLGNPDAHEPCDEMTPTEAMRRLREASDAISKSESNESKDTGSGH